jgi:hypothetical protein
MKNLDLGVWGPSTWRALHAVSFTPDQGGHLKFFESLPDVLPCASCGAHLREIYAQHPIDVSSVQVCSLWLWKVHDEVNRSLKKSTSYSYADLVRDYTVGVPAESRPHSNRKPYLFIFVLCLVILAIVFLWKRCKKIVI